MILIEDSTLREGEQSPGVAFSTAQKLGIAERLAAAGIGAIEVGTPAMGGPEEEAIRHLVAANLPLRLIGWNRGRKEDLQRSFDCGLDSVHIGLPASDVHLKDKFSRDRSWVIEQMQVLVDFAKQNGAWVSVSAEDSGRADADFLVEYATAVNAAGADRMRVSDTVGVLDYAATESLFKRLSTAVPLPLQAHMHNDYGMSTANALAAVRGGARHVHGTVNGLGERAGITALDELVFVLEKFAGISTGVRTELLAELSDYVAAASGRPLPANKPVTGQAMFEHESGIHVDGMLKLATSFEAYPPEAVGRERRVVIGKHTGTGAVQHVLAALGINAERDDLEPTVQRIRHEAVRLGRALTSEEVLEQHRQPVRT